jgi:hypothetical protein
LLIFISRPVSSSMFTENQKFRRPRIQVVVHKR